MTSEQYRRPCDPPQINLDIWELNAHHMHPLIARLVILAMALTAFAVWMSVSPALAESSAWIPLEEEHEIARLQYPERYPPPLLLPDLQTLPLSDIQLVVDQSNGRRSLRFSNSVLNAGQGVLELHGKFDPHSETIHAVQVIKREDGTTLERPAGEFDYHDEHQHVHWDAFALYQVWSALPDGVLEEMRASSNKVGYCIRDIEPYEALEQLVEQLKTAGKSINVPDQPGYTSCYWLRQGMSVGWYDIYYSYTPGQSLDISHLPDGLYALLSVADPNQIIREANEANNSTKIYFNLQDEQITLLEDLNG
jgi:hypothetical protein